MILKGCVENIIFRNEDNGYTVLNLYAEDKFVTVVGIFPIIKEGTCLTLVGEYKLNPKYGEQFDATEAVVEAPSDEDGILNYLSSGLFRGVGEATAMLIVEKFGINTLNILENSPERLREVKGIGKKKAEEIAECYREYTGIQTAMLFLQKHGISMRQAMKIITAYEDQTVELVTQNPYRLVEDIDGIGFLTADSIANKLGIATDSDFRVIAGITHILKEASNRDGHTFLPEKELIESTRQLLGFDSVELIERCLPFMIINNKLKTFKIKENDDSELTVAYALTVYYNTEKGIANRLIALNEEVSIVDIDVDKEIEIFEKQHGITFHINQKIAVASAVTKGTVVITGGPGTGKTTIIRCITELLCQRKMKIELCAPTGRAAKRLGEATGGNAKTIHRLIGMDASNGTLKAQRNELNPLDADVVIVDEISMADIFIFFALLKALKRGARLILVGDKDQLPSVSAGNVLADIIASKEFIVNELTEIYRQDADSLIAYNAQLINKGEMPTINNKSRDFFFADISDRNAIKDNVISLLAERIPKHFGIAVSDIQILSPMKKGIAGVLNLNKQIQEYINPIGKEITFHDEIFRVGDKVMHVVNDYELKWEKPLTREQGDGVFNGDMGNIVDINNGAIVVDFDDGRRATYNHEQFDELSLAYAVSVHKSQGSEFKAVILALTNGSYTLLNRNLLYTAVTRAKELVVIVGSKEILYSMVKNNYIARRYSLLKELIWENREKRAILFKTKTTKLVP